MYKACRRIGDQGGRLEQQKSKCRMQKVIKVDFAWVIELPIFLGDQTMQNVGFHV